MNPRKPLAFWQDFARASRRGVFAFAKSDRLRNADIMPQAASGASACTYDCYPFPSLWSGPSRVRPLFPKGLDGFFPAGRRRSADPKKILTKRIEFARNGVNTALRRKIQRGSSLCVNPLSFLHSQPFRLLAACSPTRPQPALALAPCPVRLLARSPATKPQNPLSLAALSASRQAARAFAADLAHQISDTTKASRGYSAAGFLHFHAHAHGPARASQGREPCSKRS
jgi:hypothetical protein